MIVSWKDDPVLIKTQVDETTGEFSFGVVHLRLKSRESRLPSDRGQTKMHSTKVMPLKEPTPARDLARVNMGREAGSLVFAASGTRSTSTAAARCRSGAIVLARLGLVDAQAPAAELSLIQRLNCFIDAFRQLDEGETARLTSLSIGHDLGAQHAAIRGKHFPKFIGGGIKRQITDIQFLAQSLSHLKRAGWPGRMGWQHRLRADWKRMIQQLIALTRST